MADLSTPADFRLILDFAIGIADRGLPLAVVRLAPPDAARVPEGPHLERLRAVVTDLCRKTDRVAMAGPGQFDVLLVDCNRQGALIFAARAREGLREWEEGAATRIGCGIACFAPNLATSEALLAAADEARRRAFSSDDLVEIYGG